MEETNENGEAMSSNNGSTAHYARKQERLSYNKDLEANDNAVRGLRNRILPHIFDRHALPPLLFLDKGIYYHALCIDSQ